MGLLTGAAPAGGTEWPLPIGQPVQPVPYGDRRLRKMGAIARDDCIERSHDRSRVSECVPKSLPGRLRREKGLLSMGRMSKATSSAARRRGLPPFRQPAGPRRNRRQRSVVVRRSPAPVRQLEDGVCSGAR